MTMPADEQRQLLSRVKEMLLPDGRIILMLYTWKFAQTTCGWKSPAEFDPLIFAKASDPSVGKEDCPWSDWHDDVKLLDLAGSNLRITQRQMWQSGLFVWYTLDFGTTQTSPRQFFTETDFQEAVVQVSLPLDSFKTAAARWIRRDDHLLVETESG